jgi:hypothetical protein
VDVKEVVSMVQPLCLSALIDCEVRLSNRAHSRGSPTYWGLLPTEALLSVVKERREEEVQREGKMREDKRGEERKRQERNVLERSLKWS